MLLLPTCEGVERLIRLRERVLQRCNKMPKSCTDEASLRTKLPTPPKPPLLISIMRSRYPDGEADTRLTSRHSLSDLEERHRCQSKIERRHRELPNVIFSTRDHRAVSPRLKGAALHAYLGGNDALAWINRKAKVSLSRNWRFCEPLPVISIRRHCTPTGTTRPCQKRRRAYHRRGNAQHGGQLGAPSGARRRTYERLKQYIEKTKDTLLPPPPELSVQWMKSIATRSRKPPGTRSTPASQRHRRRPVSQPGDQLREDNRLCQVHEQTEPQEPQIICSLGLFEGVEGFREGYMVMDKDEAGQLMTLPK